jgi:hypothetical protein
VNLIFSGKHSFSNGGELTVTPATSIPADPRYVTLGPVLSPSGIASDAGLFAINGSITNSPDLLTGTTSFPIGHDGK